MKEYIEREALIAELMKGTIISDDLYGMGIMSGMDFATKKVVDAPAADVVSKDLYEQIKWERDVALAQLEEYGVSLGEKADVVEVRHGRWEPIMTSKTLSFYLASGWKCSCCGYEIEDKSEKLHYPKWLKYCWNCGAKMDKEE